jgi:adenine-specific DNA-methyltransferase
MELDDFEIHEVPSSSVKLKNELSIKLADLIPDLMSDGKINLEKLKEVIGEDLDNSTERYGFYWPGKKRALRITQEPTTATLNPKIDESKNWDSTSNVFIEGDNLEVLKILQKHYHGKVKVIYIDPPYNTGNDFVYPDNFKEGIDNYLEWSRQLSEEGKKLSTNTETDGRFHSNWLNMIYPRLKLARNLLTEDGVILISIDDVEHPSLVQIVREIFGEANYLASISRVSKKTSNKGNHFAPSKDYVVVAAKNASKLPPFMDEVPEEYKKKFSETDGRGAFATVGLYQASLDPLRGCVNQRYWIQAPDGSFVLPPGPNRPEKIEDGSNKAPENREDRVWRWSFSSYLQQKDLLVFKKTLNSPLQDQDGNQSPWNVYTKYYLNDRLEDGIRPRDFIDNLTNDLGTKALNNLGLGNYFDFAKPPQLIEKFLTWVNDPEAIVLDFFAGSGSTAQAVMQLNANDGGERKFIIVQLPEPTPEGSEARRAGFNTIADLTRQRINLAGVEIANSILGQNVDIGFRAYSLADSNFTKWKATSDIDFNALEQHILELRENSKDESSADSLLTEILLKLGYSLTESIQEINIGGLSLKSIGENVIIAYLDERRLPSINQLKQVLDFKPAKFIILEDVLNGDDELKTNLVQECKSRGIEIWTA